MQPKQKIRKWDIVLVAIVCAIQSITKGWMSFLLVPASLIAIPLFVVVQIVARKQFDSPRGRLIKIMSHTLTICMLVSYVLMLGIGDTREVLAFGFYPTTIDNTFVVVLDSFARFAFWWATPILLVALTIVLLVTKTKR